MKKKQLKSSKSFHSIKNKRQKQPGTLRNNKIPEGLKSCRATTVGPFFIDESSSFSRPDYTYHKGEGETYFYGFTNSKFLYFLGIMKPKEYLLFVTVIALLLTEDLNETETKIVYAFISNVADTIQTLLEQEVILNNYNRTKESRELGNALHHDLETVYQEIDKLRKEINHRR